MNSRNYVSPDASLDARSVTRREVVAAIAALAGSTAIARAAVDASATTAPGRYKSFRPGEVWLDTAGKPIQAHGGSILAVANLFYWYGENKEFTTGKTDVWTWGVRCYSSSDLYNWEDLGLIIAPDTHDRKSPLHPSAGLDRPHILHNARTGKFVCWIKLLTDSKQTRTVLVADKITGPYEIVRQELLPLGMSAGDFDLASSPDDGKAYMYFERVHTEMICADLTDDYTDFTGYYTTHFPHSGPPAVREGLAYFRRDHKHYIGTTGYFPNPSEIAVADTFHGPFTVLGDLHPDDRSRTSFNSQTTSVFKHPNKKDLYIALADRWEGPLSGPEFESGETSRLVQSSYAKLFAQSYSPASIAALLKTLTPAENDVMKRYGGLNVNTSLARYVWLPIRFDGEIPRIEWRLEWSLDEFQ